MDGHAKVTGTTKFADDLAFARMVYVYVRLVRSHGAARADPRDRSHGGREGGRRAPLPDRQGRAGAPFGILPVSQDEHALCPDKVRFVGDPVVAVAAVTEDAAYEA